MYSRTVCRLKLDQGESVHLRPSGYQWGEGDWTGEQNLQKADNQDRGRKQATLKAKKNLCVSGSVVTGNGVYVSINGSRFNDIMLSLPVGNSNYTRPFPVSHQPPLFWEGILYSGVKTLCTLCMWLKKKHCSDSLMGLIREGGKTRENRSQECSLSYYNRLVKTWRAERFLPTELENSTMAALTPPLTQQLYKPKERWNLRTCMILSLFNFLFNWQTLLSSEMTNGKNSNKQGALLHML